MEVQLLALEGSDWSLSQHLRMMQMIISGRNADGVCWIWAG